MAFGRLHYLGFVENHLVISHTCLMRRGWRVRGNDSIVVDRLPGIFFDAVDIDRAIDDAVVVHFITGEVSGLSDQRNVARRYEEVIVDVRRCEIPLFDKVVPERRDVFIQIKTAQHQPVVPADQRRQRRPSAIAIAEPPGNPSRPPVGAGHPKPAIVGIELPAAIMVSRPAPRLIRIPGPSIIRIGSLADGVRPPTDRHIIGHPDPAEAVMRKPVPVSSERLVKRINRDGLRRDGCGARREGCGVNTGVGICIR